jgi:FAD/FMN-containing dehydrogenase
MRGAATICVGLATALTAHGRAVISKATIEDCLTESGVPIDTQGSAGWEQDAAPFNVRVPYTPVAISVPTTIEHIQSSVLCGKKLGIKVSPKSGGHSYASLGFGGENGHLLVELDRMYGVTVDEVTQVATVQPGARLGHLATVLYDEYNRAIAHGTCPGCVYFP